MSNMIIDWDAVPDIITKEQFYKFCHISKSTAMQLLRSGKVPCEYSGSRTHCYKIRKEDVRTYFESREIFPELYAAPKGWYCDTYDSKITGDLPDYIQIRIRSSRKRQSRSESHRPPF